MVQALYTRYYKDWENFQESLVSDALGRGYDVNTVLGNFPEPVLPKKTVAVGETGNWTSFDG